MDTSRLGRGEMIAAVSAIALLLIMFIFSWFGFDAQGGLDLGGANAWESFGLIDLILFITVVAAVGLAAMKANSQSVDLPVAGSAIVAGLGILSVVLILFRIISPPDFGLGDLGDLGGDVTRKIGVFLGLIAAGGIAYGGYESMQEEGTSFSGQADRLQDRDPPVPPVPPAPRDPSGPGGPPPAV